MTGIRLGLQHWSVILSVLLYALSKKRSWASFHFNLDKVQQEPDSIVGELISSSNNCWY